MRIRYQTFSLPKSDGTFDEYEDACFPRGADYSHSLDGSFENSTFNCAVCDGASDSVFSGYWAGLLSKSYCDGDWLLRLDPAFLQPCINQWNDHLSNQQLPWYAANKALKGSFAALVGLSLFRDNQQWSSLSVGDCCMFHIRDGKITTMHPLLTSADFGTHPELISSKPETNAGLKFDKTATGTWKDGDSFYMMSDAMACWFLNAVETFEQSKVISLIENIQSDAAFSDFVGAHRSRHPITGLPVMKDDDVTLVKLVVSNVAGELDCTPFNQKRFALSDFSVAAKVGVGSAISMAPVATPVYSSSTNWTATKATEFPAHSSRLTAPTAKTRVPREAQSRRTIVFLLQLFLLSGSLAAAAYTVTKSNLIDILINHSPRPINSHHGVSASPPRSGISKTLALSNKPGKTNSGAKAFSHGKALVSGSVQDPHAEMHKPLPAQTNGTTADRPKPHSAPPTSAMQDLPKSQSVHATPKAAAKARSASAISNPGDAPKARYAYAVPNPGDAPKARYTRIIAVPSDAGGDAPSPRRNFAGSRPVVTDDGNADHLSRLIDRATDLHSAARPAAKAEHPGSEIHP